MARESMRDAVAEAWPRLKGNVTAIARELGISRTGVYHHARKLKLLDKPIAEGQVHERKTVKRKLPRKGEVARYILTSAQNNTHVHPKVWENLLALGEHYDAEILVGTFTYNMNRYGRLAVKRNTKVAYQEDLWYDPEIEEFISDERVELAPGLVWCGESNILPTASRPLSGFETYTGRDSGIFPHVKFAMESVPSLARDEATKFNYTTGTVTKRNYIQKKAGLKAEFHHGYGAVIVEVDSDGRWFVRQLNADTSGKIYDLGVVADGGEVYESERVEGITWGDVHVLNLDPVVDEICWGEGGILDTLRPKFQFVHDLLSGAKLSHHSWKDAHEQFRLHCEGNDDVAHELARSAEWLGRSNRDFCQSVVVWSNHDGPWIQRWLNETDYRKDPKNALTFLRLQLAFYEAIASGTEKTFHLLREAMGAHGVPSDVRFLKCDEPFAICRKRIECGAHGHLGPNGAKGTPLGLSKMGRKANTAHTHSAGIVDGLYVAGTATQLDWRYAKGPSSWSHSLIVTYPNGKRTIVTIWDGKWRA